LGTFENYKSRPQFWATFFHEIIILAKNGLGYILDDLKNSSGHPVARLEWHCRLVKSIHVSDLGIFLIHADFLRSGVLYVGLC
jgi:hypothetical protein